MNKAGKRIQVKPKIILSKGPLELDDRFKEITGYSKDKFN